MSIGLRGACLQALCLCVALGAAVPLQAAIVPVEGSLNAHVKNRPDGEWRTAATVVNGYGTYSVSTQISDQYPDGVVAEVARVEAVLEISSQSTIRILGDADVSAIVFPYQPSATLDGVLSFNVTEAGDFLFDWTHSGSLIGFEAQATLSREGTGILNCLGELLCDTAQTQHAASGILNLLPGNYELNFAAANEYFSGGTAPYSFQLSLSPVPLPNSVWLLLSGLLPIFWMRRRSVAKRSYAPC